MKAFNIVRYESKIFLEYNLKLKTRIAQVVEHRTRNPEVRIPVLVQIFLLRSYIAILYIKILISLDISFIYRYVNSWENKKY